MDFSLKGCKISVSPLFVSFLCIILLIDTTGIMLFGLLAVFIHESGHLFFMFISEKQPETVKFRLGGIIIKTRGFSCYKYDFLIALGGCLFNFLAFVFGIFYYYHSANEMWFLFSASNFGLMIFNLAPINGLDGMDLIRLKLLSNHSPEKVEKICNAVSCIFIIICLCLSIIAVIFLNLNPSVLICLIYLLILTLTGIKRTH